jgi:16S rRNA G966 N2-methylase RsmD
MVAEGSPDQGKRYDVHRYLGRKPYTLVARTLQRSTEKSDLILDPFAGSGTIPCEALILGRRAIASDIDPFAIFLTRMLCISPISPHRLGKAYERVRARVEEPINELYATPIVCDQCGGRLVRHWTLYTDGLARAPAEETGPPSPKAVGESSRRAAAKIVCPRCRNWSKARVLKAEALGEPQENQGETKPRQEEAPGSLADQVQVLERHFSPTNLKALTTLHRAIGRERRVDREMLLYAFSANLAKSSLLNTFRKHGRRWILSDPHGMSVPRQPLEFNVWMGFQNRYLDLVKAKEETNRLIDHSHNQDQGLQLFTSSATRIAAIGEGTIDHILTDPPYSDTISYSKLHALNRAWLDLGPSLTGEITPADPEQYRDSVSRSLQQMAVTLRRQGTLTMIVENTSKTSNARQIILGAFKEAPDLAGPTTSMALERGREYLLVRSRKRAL